MDNEFSLIEKKLLETENDDIYQSYLYYQKVVQYGHMPLFSGIIDIDLDKVKKGLRKLEMDEYIDILDEAIMLNEKYEDEAYNIKKAIIFNIFADFKACDVKFLDLGDKFLQILKKHFL